MTAPILPGASIAPHRLVNLSRCDAPAAELQPIREAVYRVLHATGHMRRCYRWGYASDVIIATSPAIAGTATRNIGAGKVIVIVLPREAATVIIEDDGITQPDGTILPREAVMCAHHAGTYSGTCAAWGCDCWRATDADPTHGRCILYPRRMMGDTPCD